MKAIDKLHFKIAFISLVLLLISARGEVSAQNKEKMLLGKEISFSDGKWEDILSKAKKNSKYIFVDAYAVWCGPCKLLKSKTFKEQQAATYFNNNFINYTIDTDKDEGTLFAEKWDVTTYPTLLFFSPEGKLLLKQVGFVNGDKLIELGKQAKSRK